jgi:hypothetical protein
VADGSNPITIRDIDVPFWRIVTILIKWSIAAIPAAIIITILYALIFALLGGIAVGILDAIGVSAPELPAPASP